MSLPAESSGAAVTFNESPLTAHQATTAVENHDNSAATSSPHRGMLIVGSVCVAVGIGALALAWSSVERVVLTRLMAILGVVCGVIISLEIAHLLRHSSKRYSPLNYVPSSGALLICGAAVLAAFVDGARDEKFTSALLSGPPLTVGAVLIVRALVARVWDAADGMGSLVPGFPRDVKGIAEGEVFSLNAGILVPTDCRVRSGTCAVLERYLSPDSHFRVKDESDVIFAGSYILSGQVSAEALTGSYDSCLKRLEQAVLPGLRWVEESLRREHDHIITPLVYVLLFCFVSAAIFWDERGAAGSTILLASGSILGIALLLQVGEALYATRSRLVRKWAQRGFLLNSAKAWSEIYNVKEIAFDRSRLASSTACQVRELDLMDDRISEHALCACIASVVGRADDKALATIGDYCQRVVGIVDTDRVVDLREYEGRGICGSVKGIEFSIGSEEFLVDRGILIQPSDSIVEEAADGRAIMVAIGDDVIARFHVAFGQMELVSEDALSKWPKNLHGRIVDSTEKELSAATLLVRGDESDAVGRSHSPEVAFLRPNTLEVPPSSLVALTEHLEALPSLVRECRRHVHEVLRARAWILFATFVAVCLVFAGVVTPVLPVALVPVIALFIFI